MQTTLPPQLETTQAPIDLNQKNWHPQLVPPIFQVDGSGLDCPVGFATGTHRAHDQVGRAKGRGPPWTRTIQTQSLDW